MGPDALLTDSDSVARYAVMAEEEAVMSVHHPQVRRDWIAVVSAEHVRRGLALDILQVCHGREGPLRRLRAGDRVALYSPSERMRGGERVRAFTALGIVADDTVVQVEMENGFRPFRRAVHYLPARAAPVEPLRQRPGFVLAGPGWGAKLRFGLVAIDARSMDAIGVPDDPALAA